MLLNSSRFYSCFTLLLRLLCLRHAFTNCFSAAMPIYRASFLPHILFTGQRAGKVVLIRHKMYTYCNISYKQQNKWHLVPLCSYVTYRADFRTLTLLNQMNGFFLFQSSSPFSCAIQLLLGKKTECMWQKDKVENQLTWQSIASECC